MVEPAIAIGRIKRNSPRFVMWWEILGTDTVVLESPLPAAAVVPTYPGSKDLVETQVYKISVVHLTEEQLARFSAYLVRRFELQPSAVSAILRGLKDQGKGIPVLASDVVVSLPIR